MWYPDRRPLKFLWFLPLPQDAHFPNRGRQTQKCQILLISPSHSSSKSPLQTTSYRKTWRLMARRHPPRSKRKEERKRKKKTAACPNACPHRAAPQRHRSLRWSPAAARERHFYGAIIFLAFLRRSLDASKAGAARGALQPEPPA